VDQGATTTGEPTSTSHKARSRAARHGEHHPGVDAAQEDVEGSAQAFGSGGVELGGEQRPHGDRGGETEHLVHQVDPAAIVPVRHGRGDLPAHHGDVAAQVLVPEGGLHDQALAAVILVSDARQAVAHRRPDPLVDQARSVENAEVGRSRTGVRQTAAGLRAVILDGSFACTSIG
jgi:hypothetical protein